MGGWSATGFGAGVAGAFEAARTLGVPEGTIRTRIFHGKRKLREWLAQEGIR